MNMRRRRPIFSSLLWSLILGISLTASVSLLLFNTIMTEEEPMMKGSMQQGMQQQQSPQQQRLAGRKYQVESPLSSSVAPVATTSACLYIMDDNHFLIEWLAYHYHVINLRNLIMTLDPNSLTSPYHVLRRWHDRMSIKVWKDEQFLPEDFEQKVRHRTRTGKDPALQYHRQRQAEFNMECLREHKRQGRGWTMLVDVDEYMTFNPAVRDFDPADSSRNQDWAVPPIEEPGSLSILLNSIIIPNPDFDEIETPCLPVFRRQFSATESPDSEVNAMTPLGFEGSTFQTMRWRRYGYDVEDYKTRLGTACEIRRHIPNKVIVDLDRMRLQDLYHPENSGNPHAPLEICPINVYLKLNKTPLIAHHYMGTLDQWLYRVNDKRGQGYRLARYKDLNFRIGTEATDHVRPWLRGFVAAVGEAEAQRLLKGVGELEPLPGMNSTVSEHVASNQSIEEYPKYKVGDVVQANYKSDGPYAWAEVTAVFPNDYYNLIYYDECTEEIATSARLMRRLGHAVDTEMFGVDMEQLAMRTAKEGKAAIS